MKINISITEAINYLLNDPYASWTADEAAKLAEWYAELEEIEFCPVAIRCEWSSYESLQDINRAYGLFDDDMDVEDLREHTHVIEVKGLTFGGKVYSPASFLVMDF